MCICIYRICASAMQFLFLGREVGITYIYIYIIVFNIVFSKLLLKHIKISDYFIIIFKYCSINLIELKKCLSAMIAWCSFVFMFCSNLIQIFECIVN